MTEVLSVQAVSGGYQVAFPYRPNLVEAIKTLPQRRYQPDTKTWFVPLMGGEYLWALLQAISGIPVEYGAGVRTSLSQAELQAAQSLSLSKAAGPVLPLVVPSPEGRVYRPFQVAGIQYGMSRPNVLFGDEMGLGKTIEVIGLINCDPAMRKVLVICPASLRVNWQRELTAWLVRPMSVGLVNGGWPDTDIVVLNYDILIKHIASIRAETWDMLICDEAHYLKNPKARRTKLVVGAWDRDPSKAIPAIAATRKVFMTGTPIPNRPVEGWTLFHSLAPDVFQSWRTYVMRYCNGHKTSFGWDVSGASNLSELQTLLRTHILVRRLKREVLTDLPAKERQVLELPPSKADMAIIEAEQTAMASWNDRLADLTVAVELAKAESDVAYRAAVAALREGAQVAFTEMSIVRHQTAMATVPYVIEHVQACLDQGVLKLLIFAHHKDVIAALVDAFRSYGVVSVTGATPKDGRQAAVDEFQINPLTHIFVGNILAAGVGITLTAASHVVFAELDWVPGNVTQAEDRAHRMGQTDSVLVQHLVLEGSLGATMARRLVAKQRVIDAALDNEMQGWAHDPILCVDPPETRTLTRTAILEAAATYSAAQVAAIHEGLRTLSAACDGASSHDAAGFNKLDTRIGKALAAGTSLTPGQAVIGRKLVWRYRRQVTAMCGEEIVALATQEHKGGTT